MRRDRDLGMEFEAPGALCAERLLRSGAPVMGFVLAQEPHELCRWDLGARRQDVVVLRVVGRVPLPPRAPAGKDLGEPLLDAADDTRNVLVGGSVLPDEARAQSIGACDEDPLDAGRGRSSRVGVGVQTRAVREALSECPRTVR